MEQDIDPAPEPIISCPIEDFPNEDHSFEGLQVQTALDMQEKTTGIRPQEIDLDEMELTEYPYRDEYERILDEFLSNKIDKETFMANKYWLELYIDPLNPANSALRCKVCYHYGPKFSITARHQSHLSREKGDIKLTKAETKAMIKRHMETVTHKKTYSILKQNKIDEINNVQHSEKPWHKKTNNNYRTVYHEIMHGNSFNSHGPLVELQEFNGADMGTGCKSRTVVKKMTVHLSKEMHEEVITFLKENEPDLSLIMDEGTDNWNNHYLSVLIQTIQNSRPVVFFYRLIHLFEAGETAADLKNALKKVLEVDGLWDYVKEKLVGLVTDGAATMIDKDLAIEFLFDLQTTFHDFQLKMIGL